MESDSKFFNDFTPYFSPSNQLKALCQGAHYNSSGTPCTKRLINSFLYTKYSSSQNYYFSKEVNNILAGNRSIYTIRFADDNCMLDDEELLKRSYRLPEYAGKITLLTEYYKFHEDVPRFFILPVAQVVYNFYDKKRRINYIRVTRMLKGEEAEKINVHDSEAASVTYRGYSQNPSLANIIPPDLKRSLLAHAARPDPKLRANKLAFGKDKSILKEVSSVTVTDLNEFLGEIFRGVIPTTRLNTQMGGETDRREEEAGKELFGDKFVPLPRTFAPFDGPKNSPSHKKDATKLRFVNKDKLFFKNGSGKNLMAKKLNNEEFLKLIAKNALLSANSQKKDQFVTVSNKGSRKPSSQLKSGKEKEENSRRIQNLNINNLNININFNSLSKKNGVMLRNADVGSQNLPIDRHRRKTPIFSFKTPNEEGSIKKSATEQIPLSKLDSPTYSLLNKFKQDVWNKDIVPPNMDQTKPVKLGSYNIKPCLADTIGKLRFHKKKSADKIELPSQNTNVVNINPKRTFEKRDRKRASADQNLEQPVNVLRKQNLKRLVSHDFNVEESFLRREFKRSTQLSIKSTKTEAFLQNPKIASKINERQNPSAPKKPHKSSRFDPRESGNLKAFLSADVADIRHKITIDRLEPLPISKIPPKMTETNHTVSSKKAHRTLESNLLAEKIGEDPHLFSINKYTTMTNTVKPPLEDTATMSLKYKTLNCVNLFSKKSSIPDAKVKLNIENSLKG